MIQEKDTITPIIKFKIIWSWTSWQPEKIEVVIDFMIAIRNDKAHQIFQEIKYYIFFGFCVNLYRDLSNVMFKVLNDL